MAIENLSVKLPSGTVHPFASLVESVQATLIQKAVNRYAMELADRGAQAATRDHLAATARNGDDKPLYESAAKVPGDAVAEWRKANESAWEAYRKAAIAKFESELVSGTFAPGERDSGPRQSSVEKIHRAAARELLASLFERWNKAHRAEIASGAAKPRGFATVPNAKKKGVSEAQRQARIDYNEGLVTKFLADELLMARHDKAFSAIVARMIAAKGGNAQADAAPESLGDGLSDL